TGTKGDDLQASQTDEGAGYGNEISDHVSNLVGSAHRILGDHSLELAQAQVIGAVQHTAISVATAIDKVVAVFLGSSHIHHRAGELLSNQSFGSLGAKVAQEDYQCITSGSLCLGNSSQ